jgi:multicomponent Na+:H+ antiporter subunit G
MSWLADLLCAGLLLSGSALVLVAAIGIVRLPDVLCRSHALAKAMTLGISLMLAGLWIHLGREAAASGLKIVLAVFFQLLTIPVSSHLLALVAWKNNLPRWRHGPVQDHRRPATGSAADPQ